MTRIPLLVIVGPTAVGKTALSLRIARDFAVEIISADSRQIYRGLDIGTAKATAAEQAVAPHHLIDIIEPDDVLTLAQFQRQAYAIIEAAFGQRHRLPLLVGGTGQWVQAVVEGWNIPRVPPDPALRAELEAQAQVKGPEALYATLVDVDPEAAQKIDPRNLRRVIRALEVYQKSGIPMSQLQRKEAPPYHMLQIGLTMSRELLYKRIDQRVDRMMEMGLLAEIRRLVKTGQDWANPAMLGLGYRQLGSYLRGEMSLEEAIETIKKETRRFVRQQYNWFRLDDERIHWVDIGEGLQRVYPEIRNLIETDLTQPHSV